MLQNIKNMFQPQVPQSVIEKAVNQAMTGNGPAVAYDAIDYENNRRKELVRQLVSELMGITTKTSNSMLQPISVTDQMKRDVTLEALLKPTQIAKDITLESWNDVSHGKLPEHGVMGLITGKGYVPDTRTSGTQALESHGYDPNSLGTQLIGGGLDMAADPLTYISGLGAGKVAGMLPKASGLVSKLGVGAAEDATFGGIYGGLEAAREGGDVSDILKNAGIDAAMFAGLGIPLRAAGHGLGKLAKTDTVQNLLTDAQGVLADEAGTIGRSAEQKELNSIKKYIQNINNKIAKDPAYAADETNKWALDALQKRQAQLEEVVKQQRPATPQDPFVTPAQGYNPADSITTSEAVKAGQVGKTLTEKAFGKPYQEIVNDFSKLDKYTGQLDNYLKKTTGKGLSVEDNAAIKAINFRSSHQGEIAQVLNNVLMGPDRKPILDAVGQEIPGLKKVVSDIMPVVKNNWQEFELAVKLQHSVDWFKRGQVVWEESSGLNKAFDAVKKINEALKDDPANAELLAKREQLINEYEQGFVVPELNKLRAQYPNIDAAMKQYTDWVDTFAENWLVKSGLKSQAEWDAMKAAYGNYIPLNRVMDDAPGVVYTKPGVAKNVVKSAKGSPEKTYQSLESVTKQVADIVTEGRKNGVKQAFYKNIDMLEKAAESGDEAAKQLLANWEVATTEKGGNVSLMVDGEKKGLQIGDQGLFDSIAALDPVAQSGIIKFARNFTMYTKTLITGLNPVWYATRGMWRDPIEAFVKSETLPITPGVKEWVFVRDLTDSVIRSVLGDKAAITLRDVPIKELYKRSGLGHMSPATATDMKISGLEGMTKFKDMGALKSAGYVAKAPLRGLNTFMGGFDRLHRMPEFARTLREAQKTKGYYDQADIELAMKRAAEVTTNFSQFGRTGHNIDAFVQYFSASLNGLDRTGKAFKNNPGKFLTAAATSITLPSMALYYMNYDNPEYQQMNRWTKDNYFCIPRGDGTFIKIAKPYTVGFLFSTMPERVMDWLHDNDPTAWSNVWATIQQQLFPSTSVTALSSAIDVSDIAYNGRGRNYMGTPILSYDEQQMIPGARSRPTTTNIANSVAQGFNSVADTVGANQSNPLRQILGSPVVNDYLMKSNLGVLYEAPVQMAGTEGTTPQDGGILDRAQNYIGRKMTVDPVYSSSSQDRFYTRLDELKKKENTIAAGKGYLITGEDKNAMGDELWRLEQASYKISDLRKQQNEAELAGDTEKARQIQQQMNQIADAAVDGSYKPMEPKLYGGERPMEMPGAGTQEWAQREGFGVTPEKSTVYKETWKAYKEGDRASYDQAMRDLSAIHDATAYGLKYSLDYQVKNGYLTQPEAEGIVQDYYAVSTKEQQRSAATSFLIDAVSNGDDASARKWAVDAVAADKTLDNLKTSLQNRAADDKWKSNYGLLAQEARKAGDFEAEKEYLKLRDSMPESYILAGASSEISADVYTNALNYLAQAGAEDKAKSSGNYRGYSGYSSASSKGTVPLESVQAILNSPATTVQDLRNKYQATPTAAGIKRINYRLADIDSIVSSFVGQDPLTVEAFLKKQGLPMARIAEIIGKLKGGQQWQNFA